jgi:hypothetical protein
MNADNGNNSLQLLVFGSQLWQESRALFVACLITAFAVICVYLRSSAAKKVVNVDLWFQPLLFVDMFLSKQAGKTPTRG